MEKEIFFAQYWGKEYTLDNGALLWNVNQRAFPLCNTACLLLKPLSSISDEEAKQLPNREYDGFSKPYESAKQFLKLFDLMGFLTSEEADILRKLRFAIPYMNYSVEQLVELGWVKLV